MKFLFINGPNLNFIGIREQHIYGTKTYDDLKAYIGKVCNGLGIRFDIFQSNHEGAIVDKIQQAYNRFDGIIINPAAYTHTSIAILDALNSVSIPAVEVHLTDTEKREDFRKISYTSLACIKTVMGKSFEGYKEAAVFLYDTLNGRTQ